MNQKSIGSDDEMPESAPDHRRWVRRRSLQLVIAIAGVIFGATAIILTISSFRATNCGGNSAALTACNGYLIAIESWASRHPNQPLHTTAIDSELRRDLTDLPGASWLGSARFLARLDGVRIDPIAPRTIVVACDRAYDNVPRSLVWRSPRTHAVGYSTGDSGLISPEEFANLNLSGFVAVRSIFPPDAPSK
jgi:hypothetical protein